MDAADKDSALRVVRAIIIETRALCRYQIAQLNRIMVQCPMLGPVDLTPLYHSVDLCNKAEKATTEGDFSQAMKWLGELHDYSQSNYQEIIDVIDDRREDRTDPTDCQERQDRRGAESGG